MAVGIIGAQGISTQQNLFGIPNPLKFIPKIASFIPGLPQAIPDILKQLPGFGGSGLPSGGLTPQAFAPDPPCKFGFSRNSPGAPCTFDPVPGPVGGSRSFAGGGAAEVGQFGVGMVPDVVSRTVRTCLRGMQLGMDGLCYNKGVLRNDQREWPRGRRPLLTGGEMRAISTATRAAGRLERTTKRLQKIGMIKKPTSRARAPRRIAAHAPAGTSIVNVE